MISQAGQCADVGATCRKRNKILKSKRVKDFNKKAFILTLTFSAVLLIFLAEFSLAMLEKCGQLEAQNDKAFPSTAYDVLRETGFHITRQQ